MDPRHLVVLFFASSIAVVLSAATGTLLLGSLYASLMLLLLNGMRGKRLRVADVFCRVCKFPRFFAFTLFLSLPSAVVLVFLIIPGVLFGVRCFYIFSACRRSKFQDG
ncbi:MAG TPA: hypothetical protein DIU35_14570 [Candidatus Latescibacteria bacterium]|nr:hypothetical protein [Gemmatimonadota bacterium]HCR18700.1 hypothetical protein [Candidatus Latescibacterota bacterium]|tara:strand:+ start:1690 stop:2013 length:324 start_codon:yes stop_codon:yes gene_type:complete